MRATSGQLAFHARVAANVLGIVAREIELGPAATQAGIGPAATQPPGAAELGSVPAAETDLARDVAAKLAVANPSYFEPVPPQRSDL